MGDYSVTTYSNLSEWASSLNGFVRYWVYRRIYTPYEREQKFMDESIYEDSMASFGYIKEVTNLNGDWLLGIEECDDDGLPYHRITYYRLSEIRIDRVIKSDEEED